MRTDNAPNFGAKRNSNFRLVGTTLQYFFVQSKIGKERRDEDNCETNRDNNASTFLIRIK